MANQGDVEAEGEIGAATINPYSDTFILLLSVKVLLGERKRLEVLMRRFLWKGLG